MVCFEPERAPIDQRRNTRARPPAHGAGKRGAAPGAACFMNPKGQTNLCRPEVSSGTMGRGIASRLAAGRPTVPRGERGGRLWAGNPAAGPRGPLRGAGQARAFIPVSRLCACAGRRVSRSLWLSRAGRPFRLPPPCKTARAARASPPGPDSGGSPPTCPRFGARMKSYRMRPVNYSVMQMLRKTILNDSRRNPAVFRYLVHFHIDGRKYPFGEFEPLAWPYLDSG